MDYIALYRKWRPMTFDEVVEQRSVVTILKNTVKSRRIGHAYLFCGTRGTGKTSVAKIFSRAVNCLSPVDGNPCNQCEICRGIIDGSLLDVSEIDAASNNGVENVRGIIDESSYQAARAEYKVFIIDEVHMLSTSAFNALLKTLEEPPEKVIFILATTEPQKLPVTITSRCQRFDFKRISREGIVARLEEICHGTGIEYEEAALRLIAGKADGGLRDAISLLDQTISLSGGKVTAEEARRASGSIDAETLESFANAIISRDAFSVLALTDKVFASGIDPSNFICELIDVMRKLMIILSTRNPKQFLYDSDADVERLKKLGSATNIKEITMIVRELSSLENDLKWSVQRKIIFEAGMLSLCDRNWGRDAELADRIQVLERSVADLVNDGLKVTVRGGGVAPVRYEADDGGKDDAQDSLNDGNAPGFTEGSLFNEPAPVSEQDLTREVLDSLEPVPEADWKEFIATVSDKFGGVGSLISTQCSHGYIVGGTLFIPLASGQFVRMITDGKRRDAVENAAKTVFGRALKVTALTEEEFFEQAPELMKSAGSGESEEEDLFGKAAEAFEKFAENKGILFEEGTAGEGNARRDEGARGDGSFGGIFDDDENGEGGGFEDGFDSFEPEPYDENSVTAKKTSFTTEASPHREEEHAAASGAANSGFDDYSRTFGYEPPGDDDVPPDEDGSMYGDDED